jgi:hypothetical protein
MRQLIGSTAEWAANNMVLAYGEIGVERVSAAEYKVKVGDGTTQWSALPYITSGGISINAPTQAALDAKLAIAGGTMTGDLILAHSAAKPLEAVTLTQLQNEVTKLNTADTGKVDITGGTLTGPLFLAQDAISNKEPVTLEQLNKALASYSAGTTGVLVYAGTVDVTDPYAAPVPAVVGGNVYAVAKAGTVHATWHSHMTNASLASVSIGDYVVYNATTSKFDHIKNAVDLTAYVPLAGTNAVSGKIEWAGAAGSKSGVSIISGKGGSIDDAVIDNGIF